MKINLKIKKGLKIDKKLKKEIIEIIKKDAYENAHNPLTDLNEEFWGYHSKKDFDFEYMFTSIENVLLIEIYPR